jgi:hypothetical protein
MNLEPVIDKPAVKAHEQEEALRWEGLTSDLELGIALVEVGLAGISASRCIAYGLSWRWVLAVGISEEIITRAALAGNQTLEDWGKDLMGELGDRIVDRHQDIADDPPDERYAEIVELGPLDYGAAATGDSMAVARSCVTNRLAEEEALLGAILPTLEKFSGACAAPDNPYIRVQALALKEYSELLIESLTGSNLALQELRTATESTGFGNATVYPDTLEAFQARVAEVGFLQEEIQVMADAGFEDGEIDSLLGTVLGWDLEAATEGTPLACIDSTMQNNLALIGEFQEFVGRVQTIIDTTELVWIEQPHADAGGPYVGQEGTPVSFDASASTDPLDRTCTYLWDFDADGVFGDEVGPTAQYSWSSEGVRLVGLKLTNTDAFYDVAYALVDIESINDGPVFLGVEPDTGYVRMTSCDPQTFSVVADDADGDLLTYTWTLNDSLVGSTDSWDLTPAAVPSGRCTVTVHISDGSAYSPDNWTSWRVDVPNCTSVEEPDQPLDWRPLAVHQGQWDQESAEMRITLVLPRRGIAGLDIFSLSGRLVRSIEMGSVDAGERQVSWDGLDTHGRRVASGVYMCRVRLDDEEATTKLVLVR